MWKTIYNSMKTKKLYVKDDDIQKISPFFFLRWLGNNRNTVIAAGQLNQYPNIPMVPMYHAIHQTFGGNNIYINMPKFKYTNEEYDEAIQWYFNIGKSAVHEYTSLMSQTEIERVQELYDEMLEYEQ